MRPRAKAETAGAVTRLAAIALTSILTVCGPGVAQQSVTPKPATPQRAAAKSAPPAKPSAAESTKCIGVVSAIGDTFHLRKIGITVFNNDSNTVPIESWQIDNLVISKISTFLSKSWTVRRVNYPKGAFSSLDEKHPLFYNYDDDLQGIVRRLSSSTRCDHYAVVVKGGSRFSDTNQFVYGLGIVESGASFLTFDLIYALYWIRIYDGQTYEVIGKRGAITEQSNPLLGLVTAKSIGGPYLKVDRSWWPESDAAKSTMLKDGIRSLVEKSLDVTMPLILRVE
jgi:hypothetical protein